MPRILRRAALVLALSAICASAQADIFSFTDADGTVHFTNIPSGDKRYRVYIRGNGGSRAEGSGAFTPVAPAR